MSIHKPKIVGCLQFHDIDAEFVGDVMAPRHKHPYDHTTVVMRGAVRVNQWKDGQSHSRIYRHGQGLTRGRIPIPADVEHEIIAETADAWVSCDFPHRSRETGDIVEKYEGDIYDDALAR